MIHEELIITVSCDTHVIPKGYEGYYPPELRLTAHLEVVTDPAHDFDEWINEQLPEHGWAVRGGQHMCEDCLA